MSHAILQRVVVRMLYDPDFAARVLADPDGALAGVDVSQEERAWLREPDPRAWGADDSRPLRSMTALLQQFPASAALAVRAAGSPGAVSGFYGSAWFHRAVMERGSLALAFGEYLAELGASGPRADGRVIPLVRLEQAIVRLRQAVGPVPPPLGGDALGLFRLSPDKALHVTAAGIGDLHEEVHLALNGAETGLARAVLDTALAMPSRPVDPSRREPLLLELARDDGPRVRFPVGTAEITEAFHELLSFAEAPRTFDALMVEVERLGADPDEAPEVIEGLIDEGTLVPVSDSPAA